MIWRLPMTHVLCSFVMQSTRRPLLRGFMVESFARSLLKSSTASLNFGGSILFQFTRCAFKKPFSFNWAVVCKLSGTVPPIILTFPMQFPLITYCSRCGTFGNERHLPSFDKCSSRFREPG